MARRYRRRSPSDEINPVAIGILLLLGAGSLMRGLGDLPRPWQIAGAILAGSGVALCVWALAAWLRRRRAAQLLGAELQALSPDAFEERVKLLLADLGWTQLQRRGGSGDRGVDLVGTVDGQRTIVQCKRYARSVPPAMVRDLVGARSIQRADRALLVTTGTFTPQGYAEASDQPVDLWDGAELARQVRRAADLRADPARRQSARRRAAIAAYLLLLVNGVTLAWAFRAGGWPWGP